jgi:glycine dehydrogenase
MTDNTARSHPEVLRGGDAFVERHIGPRAAGVATMLQTLGLSTIDELVEQAVPPAIRMGGALALPPALSEQELLVEARRLADMNEVWRSHLGMGYHDCDVPPVILRNILENPGWYTQYTPYQSEISQGRLEALLNFQSMVVDLTGLDLANASLLDEGTAAAEAMAMCHAVKARTKRRTFVVDAACHPQTIAVVRTRAQPLGLHVRVVDTESDLDLDDVFAVLVQYPATTGLVRDYEALAAEVHAADAMFVVAADVLALALLRPPGEFGADVAVGSTQRLGVPMGFGGPHAAYFATTERHKRRIPGRIVGVSQDSTGRPALRLALQTREQHIRRERATSNICTSQVLLAIIAGMYAVYHGPEGITAIAHRVHLAAEILARGLGQLGFDVEPGPRFDTVCVRAGADAPAILARARDRRINLRHRGLDPSLDEGCICISLDETTRGPELSELFAVFGGDLDPTAVASGLGEVGYPAPHARTSAFLTHPVFSTHRSETELLRYIHRLQSLDLSLTTSMIPLGSCTMKLNATAEMIPVTWKGFGGLHPFAPAEQVSGYSALMAELRDALAEITGFHGVSLQPNAGSQGEYSGLLVIRAWQESRGQGGRDVCIIPSSAHGTNPASAVMAGMRVVTVRCDDQGNIDVADLRAKAEAHTSDLSALMITYPSTHGVFEETIQEICAVVHEHGGQVYMDGANMNAQVGLCRPGDMGADVCHLNLHKTFCIPHGGGGPGMGPICVAAHLSPFLPGHPLVKTGGDRGVGAISAAPYGSPSILPISWAYVRMMGAAGLRRASEIAILSANYIAARLGPHYPVLYKGANDRVAHECILDLRGFRKTAGVEVVDVAKRLMDYGFHAPTISWPVAGTMMIEPTESESVGELDRFCEAMIAIRGEIAAVEAGEADRENNLLKNAPHTAAMLTGEWDRPYSRQEAVFPAAWTRAHKFWPPVGRIDDAYGDRNLMCSCPPLSAYEDEE